MTSPVSIDISFMGERRKGEKKKERKREGEWVKYLERNVKKVRKKERDERGKNLSSHRINDIFVFRKSRW